MQAESTRRIASEQRLHAQLLLQNENMIAMEMKLLRLEAKATANLNHSAIHHPHRSGSALSSLRNAGVGSSSSNAAISSSSSIIGNIHNSSSNNNNASSNANTANPSLLLRPVEDGCESTSLGSSTATPSIFAGSSSRTALNTNPVHIRTNIAIMSSTASLASGVTADEGLNHDEEIVGNDDDNGALSENDDHDDNTLDDFNSMNSSFTRRRPRMTLQSMMQNDPESSANVNLRNEAMMMMSTRATRGPPSLDGGSSLATSMSNATGLTAPSTTMSATTAFSNANTLNNLSRSVVTEDDATLRSHLSIGNRSRMANLDSILGLSPPPPRSRSQSPMTAPSVATSIGTSIAAVAPSGSRRATTTPRGVVTDHQDQVDVESRPVERAVSFVDTAISTADILFTNVSADGGDSLTMPDELDTYSDAVVEAFTNGSRIWREEYEARLDAIQKRFPDDNDHGNL